jgi:hypothetical protein
MTAEQLPGGGVSRKEVNFEDLLSPEEKARVKAIRIQLERVDGVLRKVHAMGVNVTDLIITKDNRQYSVFRDSSPHVNGFNQDEETLMIENPMQLDETEITGIKAYLGIEPGISDPAQANYAEFDDEGILLEEAVSFDAALQSVTSLIDYLGFPPPPPTSEQI